MKKLLFISLLMMGFVALNAQEKDVNDEAKTNGPEIKFENTSHDYGDIVVNGDGTYNFEFTNTGNEPLVLSKPRSSCGCTVPSWPKEPILPGESSAIKVTYNTRRVGPFSKSVTVFSNAKTVILRIKGKVVTAPGEQLPEKPSSMGSVPSNDKK